MATPNAAVVSTPFAVDQADHRQGRRGDDDHLQAHRQALADNRPEQLPVGLQIAKLGAREPQRQVARVDVDDQPDRLT